MHFKKLQFDTPIFKAVPDMPSYEVMKYGTEKLELQDNKYFFLNYDKLKVG